MDTSHALIHCRALEDISEADEASGSLDQALHVLYEISLIEGPGTIADAYERAAWRQGANVNQTKAVLRRANTARQATPLST